jgi:hypothetical protein
VLKNFFAPVVLFVGSMSLLTRMNVLPANLLPDAYNGAAVQLDSR